MLILLKRQLIGQLFIVSVLAFFWPLSCFAAQPIRIIYNNVQLELDVPPVLDNSRVLVPLRAILECLGAQIEWDTDTNMATAITRTKFLQLSVGANKAYLNGNKIDLDVPTKIVNGRIMVPIRFVSENLGARVDWQAPSKNVIIKDDGFYILDQEPMFLSKGWTVSYVRQFKSSNGYNQDLFRITSEGKGQLVVKDISRDYEWNPSGCSLSIDQEVLVYGGGTANPTGTWFKEIINGRETLISYPSGIMGPSMQASWLNENKLLTSQGTSAPEARAIVVDTTSGEIILRLPQGFNPLGQWKKGFLGVIREKDNWALANLAFWEPGKDTETLFTEMASNFSFNSTGERVVWLDGSASKPLEGSSYVLHQIKIYHLESGQLRTYPLWGHEASWSPDGKYLVVPAGSKLQILEVASGKINRLENFNRYPLGHFAWRPDSKLLAWEKEALNENSVKSIELWHWQVSDGEIGPLFLSENLLTREPVWSPDGTSLVYVAGERESNRLFHWDITSNIHRPLTTEEAGVTVYDPRWVPGYFSSLEGCYVEKIDRVRPGLLDVVDID